MKIIPERVTVIPDAQRNELTVIMEGFRLTLSAEESRALSYALVQGMKQLPADPLTRPFAAAPSAAPSHKPAVNSSAQEAPASRTGETGADHIRSLSA